MHENALQLPPSLPIYRLFSTWKNIPRQDFLHLVDAVGHQIKVWPPYAVLQTTWGYADEACTQPSLGSIEIKDFLDLEQARYGLSRFTDTVVKRFACVTIERECVIYRVWWMFCPCCQRDRLHRQQVIPESANTSLHCWACVQQCSPGQESTSEQRKE